MGMSQQQIYKGQVLIAPLDKFCETESTSACHCVYACSRHSSFKGDNILQRPFDICDDVRFKITSEITLSLR